MLNLSVSAIHPSTFNPKNFELKLEILDLRYSANQSTTILIKDGWLSLVQQEDRGEGLFEQIPLNSREMYGIAQYLIEKGLNTDLISSTAAPSNKHKRRLCRINIEGRIGTQRFKQHHMGDRNQMKILKPIMPLMESFCILLNTSSKRKVRA